MKRGMEDHFNWIFVMFAGAIFLAFLIGFGAKYIALKETGHNAEIARGVDLLFSGFGELTLYKNFSLEVPFTLTFTCDEFNVNHDVSMPLDEIVFAPSELNSDSIFVWAQSWNYPFDSGTFIYLINKDTTYTLYGDAIRLLELVPLPLRSQFVERDGDVAVFFGAPNLNVGGNIISIEDGPSGTVTFYGSEVKTSYHYGDLFILGAIFSQDYTRYDCNKEEAISRWNHLREIYFKKSGMLANFCSYQGIQTYLISPLDIPLVVKHLEEENSRLASCEVVF